MKTKLIAMIFFMLLTNSAADAVTLKIATLSPDGSMWMQKMREGAKEVAEKTANRVEIKYYPGGVMGDDKAVLRKIRIGQLNGGALVAGSLSQFFPDVQIYCLPMKFQSFEEIDYVRGQMDPMIISGLEKVGFITFGVAEGGFAYIMSANVPIRTVSDLHKNKVWIPDNDGVALEAVKSFEVTPIPLSIADVRAGLQTGLINTVTTPPIGAVALQWHTQVKYLTDIPFLYIYAVLTVDKKAFEQILPEDQKAVREILGRVFREIDRQNREDNVKALEVLRNQGIEFVKPPQDAMKEWHEKSASLPKLLVETEKLSQEMLNILEKNIETFRNGSKTGN
ncbi:MAG: C4-dicarboxylate ABC transporter [Desulfobacteraceae bacterium IS3]|nr:MAG: C4-dicarboxylate ABC transporter [Desulfobacteraceae bacterium IS3]